MSMIKVTHSSDISSTVGVGGEIVKSASDLQKQASTIFKCEYDALKPPKGQTGIHLVALGDSEAYPMNRNGDLFSKEACVKYHQTFVKHGHVFQHHRNKDPKKAIGTIKAAAYNPEMHRIELYIWADNEKAKDHLERLEKTGEVPFSMACVRAGTPILTIDGYRPIEEIKVGDTVLTHLGKWKRVNATMSRDVDEYREVSFISWGNRTLEITPNHSVFAASFDDIPRAYRKDRIDHPGKKWRRRHREELHKYLKWIPAGDLTDKHYMCVPMWENSCGGIGIQTARLYGYYMAEGSLSTGCTQITCNVNDCFVDEIEKLANWTSVSKKPHRLSPDKCVVLMCYGTSIRNDIEKSCGKRCENKRIPISVRTGSIEEKFNFAAAWFNGDGWQDKNGLHWSIKSDTLSTDLQMLLASVNVPSSCDRIKHPEVRGFVRSKGAVEHVVSVSNEYSDLFVGISKAVHKSVCGRSKLRTFISGNYLMVPVKGVKKIEKSTVVYNLSVKDDESYTAFGLAVHNCTVPNDRCSVCGNIRKAPGDETECEHIRDHLGKIAEDGTQIGTYNDEPRWFDISFVGRPADRIAWNLKVASAMPEELTTMSSVKRAEVEGYTLPDDLAITSERARRKLDVLQKLASAYAQCESWLAGETKPANGRERFKFELRKLAGAHLDDSTLARLRELNPGNAFAALGDAGIVLDAPSFFKYAFGPDYGQVEKYLPFVAKEASAVVREAVDTATCAALCNDGRYDACPIGRFGRPDLTLRSQLTKSAAAYGFGTSDAVTGILETMACGAEPTFAPNGTEKTAEACGVDPDVATKLARKYVMYKLAGLCAVLDGPCGPYLSEDDVIFVSAAQDLKEL